MFWSIFYFWKYSWLIIVTYKSSCVSTQQYLCGLSDSRYRARVISNLKIRMKGIFIYVLQFDKMQNTSPFMCTKFEIWAQSILKVIQSFHTVRIVLYIGCSSPVVEDLNKIKMLQLTTRSLGKIKYKKMPCPGGDSVTWLIISGEILDLCFMAAEWRCYATKVTIRYKQKR